MCPLPSQFGYYYAFRLIKSGANLIWPCTCYLATSRLESSTILFTEAEFTIIMINMWRERWSGG